MLVSFTLKLKKAFFLAVKLCLNQTFYFDNGMINRFCIFLYDDFYELSTLKARQFLPRACMCSRSRVVSVSVSGVFWPVQAFQASSRYHLAQWEWLL